MSLNFWGSFMGDVPREDHGPSQAEIGGRREAHGRADSS